MEKRKYTVFVGGCEVSDFLLTLDNAVDLRRQFKNDGYDDCFIVDTSDNSVYN